MKATRLSHEDRRKKSNNSLFQEKFKEKISIVNKDGTTTKVTTGEIEKSHSSKQPTSTASTSSNSSSRVSSSKTSFTEKLENISSPFKPLYKIPNSPPFQPPKIAKGSVQETHVLVLSHSHHDDVSIPPSTGEISDFSFDQENRTDTPSSYYSSRESTASSSRRKKKPIITAKQFQAMIGEMKKQNIVSNNGEESSNAKCKPPQPLLKLISIEDNICDVSEISNPASSHPSLRNNSYSAIHGISKKKDEEEFEWGLSKESEQTEDCSIKQKKEPSYKPYSIEDYNKINKQGYVKLGGLGADLHNEKLIEKKEKINKIREYAKEIAQINNSKISKQKGESKPLSKSKTPEEPSAREKAKEFAAKIPKPKSKRQSHRADKENDEPQPLSELEMLELQHEKDREWLKKEFAIR
ncbi:hypothetical protein C9374_011585 [Naegleria lovaniensis]|uniref:Uncharacterized protein n=1 Tax=Naegleria lovaniensis TaxID=51637 RepID=A0AA88G9J2_NAELO|nr:uncharacterized protein C9374_011585 [Naegleria lovaniensis]KAG2373920.1 hypothetical protein C9374_011585 [Naegleria lovaniensis]